MTPIFLLIGHFLFRFFTEENSIESLDLLQNAPTNSFLFNSLFICERFQILLERLSLRSNTGYEFELKL